MLLSLPTTFEIQHGAILSRVSPGWVHSQNTHPTTSLPSFCGTLRCAHNHLSGRITPDGPALDEGRKATKKGKARYKSGRSADLSTCKIVHYAVAGAHPAYPHLSENTRSPHGVRVIGGYVESLLRKRGLGASVTKGGDHDNH